jgi:hypothetical protein
MASGSQLHAIEATRTQSTDQQCMPSQVEQDETSSAGIQLPNACNKFYFLFSFFMHVSFVYYWYACRPYASLANDDQQTS